MASNTDFRLRFLGDTKDLNSKISGIKSQVTALATAIGIGFGAKELGNLADSYTALSVRINLTTGASGNFEQAMAGVQRLALETNSSLEATAQLFTKINDVGKTMGLTQQQTLGLTKTINQAVQVGGGEAASTEAAIYQFNQALQSGVLRGDEFNSVMEQAPGLSKALAGGLNVTTAELRKMAGEGKLTSTVVIKALQNQSKAVQEEFDKFPTTIGNALQRISTQWQILIGEFDQANGASKSVAQFLVFIADNLRIVERALKDAGQGFVWLGDRLKSIDSSTLDSLKSALSEVYSFIKDAFSTVGDVFDTLVGAVEGFGQATTSVASAILHGGKQVSFFQTILDEFRLVLAAVSDAMTGFNIGLKLVTAGVEFLGAGVTALGSRIASLFSEDYSQQLQNASDALFAQAEKNAREAVKLSEEHKFKTVEVYQDLHKTLEQKDAERVERSKLSFDELKKQSDEHVQKVKANADEQKKIQEQLELARKNGDTLVVESSKKKLDELTNQEKELANTTKQLDKDKLSSVQEYVEGTVKANNGVLNGALQADLMTKGYIVTLSEAGKVGVEAWNNVAQASVNSAQIAENAAKVAADGLGIDLTNALNRVSQGFTAGQAQVQDLKNNLQGMGVTGEQAANVTYQAWQKWLESAKSEAEIELAKKKLEEFREKGVVSTGQVEAGMNAIKVAALKLPNALTPVEQAFERLGIKTKQQLKDAAEIAIADFKTISASGQATQEQLKQAAERTMQAAQASGNASVQAIAKSQASIAGLNVEVDKSGKVAVQSTQDWFDSLDKVQSAAKNAGSSMSSIGDSAEEAADRTASAFEKAGESISSSLSKAGSGITEVNAQTWVNAKQIEDKLKSKGYTDEEAKHYAEKIYNDSKGSDINGATKASLEYMKRISGGYVDPFSLSRPTSSNYGYVEEQLEKFEGMIASRKQSEAMSRVAEETPNRITETKRIQLMADNHQVEFDIHQSQENSLDAMLNQLALAKTRY